MKLELGAGHRPTIGYEHNDLHPFDHIEHPGVPWELELPSGSVEEVLALGFVEHLTFFQAFDTFRNVRRMLRPGGVFLFDVPDYPVWARYYLYRLNALDSYSLPADAPPMEHIRKTLFGWQRWPGDEHKSGWDRDYLDESLREAGFTHIEWGLDPFLARGIYRRRFKNPADAHLYVSAA